jgi:hypothetical protein
LIGLTEPERLSCARSDLRQRNSCDADQPSNMTLARYSRCSRCYRRWPYAASLPPPRLELRMDRT